MWSWCVPVMNSVGQSSTLDEIHHVFKVLFFLYKRGFVSHLHTERKIKLMSLPPIRSFKLDLGINSSSHMTMIELSRLDSVNLQLKPLL